MSERSQAPRPEGEYFEPNRFASLSVLLGGIAFVALVLCMISAYVEPMQFSFSWFFAFAYFFVMRGMFLLDHRASRHRSEWSVVVRRQLRTSRAFCSPGAVVYSGAAPATSALRMDGHSAGT
jgi:hypothetical protein